MKTRFGTMALRSIKLRLLKEAAGDLLARGRMFGAIIAFVDIAFSKPVSIGKDFSFADLANFYLRFKREDIDVTVVLRDLQSVVFNEVRLDLADLMAIQATVDSRCRARNAELQMGVTTGVLSSISGPNTRREFVAEVSSLLTNRQ